jgi:hypothetical protein
MRSDAVMRPIRWAVLGALALGTACGPSVRTRVAQAMEGCVAAREPLFTAGQADRALATPLPPAVEALAAKTAYPAGFFGYQDEAEFAETQAELTCALELGARLEDDNVRAWLRYYMKSPNAPVAQHAQRLLERQLETLERIRSVR